MEEIEDIIDTSEDDEVVTFDDLFEETDEFTDNNDEEEAANEKPSTNAVSKRINEVRRKTELDTRNAVAKEMGYADYADMQKHSEKSMLRDIGYDDDPELDEVVEKILQKRLSEDPRFKKLEEYEKKEKEGLLLSQLREINNLAGTNYSSIEELSKDTLDMWEKTGNLKQAYLATEGEAILTGKYKRNAEGSMNHLASPGRASTKTKVRRLTEEEKAIYRSVLPELTEEELSKKTIEITD